MYDLKKLTDTVYYIECPTRIGIVLTDEQNAVLIDSGSDKDTAKKIKRILDENGWSLKAIYSTHSHADHIGGNKYLQNETGCKIYAYGAERDFSEHTILESTLLYGGYSPKALQNKFLYADTSDVLPLSEGVLPQNIKMLYLPGHSMNMVGFITDDNIAFIADSVSSAETIDKYGVVYNYDIEKQIETLKSLSLINASVYVPAHALPTEDIKTLADYNLKAIYGVISNLADICSEAKTFDEILSAVFNIYGMKMNLQQYALVGSTIKGYLSYMLNNGLIVCEIVNNSLLWKAAASDEN